MQSAIAHFSRTAAVAGATAGQALSTIFERAPGENDPHDIVDFSCFPGLVKKPRADLRDLADRDLSTEDTYRKAKEPWPHRELYARRSRSVC